MMRVCACVWVCGRTVTRGDCDPQVAANMSASGLPGVAIPPVMPDERLGFMPSARIASYYSLQVGCVGCGLCLCLSLQDWHGMALSWHERRTTHSLPLCDTNSEIALHELSFGCPPRHRGWCSRTCDWATHGD